VIAACWNDFRKQHPSLIDCGSLELLQSIASHLEPLLGDFYRQNEKPLLS
jgi:hypothetical protein